MSLKCRHYITTSSTIYGTQTLKSFDWFPLLFETPRDSSISRYSLTTRYSTVPATSLFQRFFFSLFPNCTATRIQYIPRNRNANATHSIARTAPHSTALFTLPLLPTSSNAYSSSLFFHTIYAFYGSFTQCLTQTHQQTTSVMG